MTRGLAMKTARELHRDVTGLAGLANAAPRDNHFSPIAAPMLAKLY